MKKTVITEFLNIAINNFQGLVIPANVLKKSDMSESEISG